MNSNQTTHSALLAHYQAYPNLQIQDVLKFLHQSAFGCEHAVTDLPAAIDRIRSEVAAVPHGSTPSVHPLDGRYSRVDLSCLKDGVSAEILAKLFVLSAKPEPDGPAALEAKLAVARTLIAEGSLPFSVRDFDAAVQRWRKDGLPALHHSEVFRSAYTPSYRVIDNRYVPFLPLFARLDPLLAQGPVVLAIEGGSAGGKTTLSELLSTLYGCTVFHMDDFFLRPEQRTEERFAQPGGNVDWERFLDEVLIPLRKGQPIRYRKFDCSTGTIAPGVEVVPQQLTVVEGAYSMHPKLAGFYDLSVFLHITPDLQTRRIALRNTPEVARLYHDRWIPMEQTYFAHFDTQARCDLTIPITP